MDPASLLIATAAAGCNAFSSVMQRKANREQPEERRFGASLLLHLVAQPAWLIGMGAMIASFLLQAGALSIGTLSAVEPVLVLELPLTLILSAAILRHPLPPRDWATAAAMAAGLALFIAILAPSGGHAEHVSEPVAAAATAATVVAVTLTAALAHVGPDRFRAALFGAAAGAGFGLTASLMKIAVTRLADRGVGALLQTWETYGTVAAGLASVVLVQAALHAGTLVAAQPGITLLDPLISLLWGTVVIGETVRTGLALIPAAAGGVLVVVAVIVLSRLSSPP
jgi:hypothetical protein